MSGANSFLPDPGFERRQNNIIDVLVPPPYQLPRKKMIPGSDCGNENQTADQLNHRATNVAIGKQGTENVRHECNSLRRPSATTPGYSINQYDLERYIRISASETCCIDIDAEDKICEENEKESRKRRRSIDEDARQFPPDKRHEMSWNVFQPYLEKCIPVKFQRIALFRDIVSSDQPTMGSFHDDLPNSVLSSHVESFPASILDESITVQCAFPSDTITITSKTGTSCKENRFTPEQIDKLISFSADNEKSGGIPTFMGQENQITTEMTLREAITWNQSNNAQNCDERSMVSSRMTTMAVCVAQLPILSVASDSEEIYISSQSTNNASKECNGRPQIVVKLNGEVHQNAHNIFSEEPPVVNSISGPSSSSLASLASMLHLPSYLLLGNPGEGYDTKSIAIHDINLWHTPQNCQTNVHYDDRDNLLMVTKGLKTVELCPPGCIRGSGIYSEHANHPALLRRNTLNSGNSNQICREVEKMREAKRGRTFIVSVGANEALYIPRGWWHRVESASDPYHQQTGQGCTAVNVWFDYHRTFRNTDTCIPKHMESFHLRQSARKYYNMHADDASRSCLGEKLNSLLCHENDVLEPISIELNELKDGISHEKPWDEGKTRHYGQLLAKCWREFLADRSKQIDGKLFMRRFTTAMEVFLLRTDLANVSHLKALFDFWHLFPVSSNTKEASVSRVNDSTKQKITEKTSIFATLIFQLSPEACFVIAQSWEKYSSSAANETTEEIKSCGYELQSEVEASYTHFFGLVGKENEDSTRAFLLDSVEQFQRGICQSLIGGLF